MDFEQVFKALKKELLSILNEKSQHLTAASQSDIENFLNQTKEKLKRWTYLLEEGVLTLDDYKWLLKSQKDLMTFQALHSAGISKIQLGHLKNTLINTIVSTVVTLVLP